MLDLPWTTHTSPCQRLAAGCVSQLPAPPRAVSPAAYHVRPCPSLRGKASSPLDHWSAANCPKHAYCTWYARVRGACGALCSDPRLVHFIRSLLARPAARAPTHCPGSTTPLAVEFTPSGGRRRHHTAARRPDRGPPRQRAAALPHAAPLRRRNRARAVHAMKTETH